MLKDEITNVGFTGSREGMRLQQIELLIMYLNSLDSLFSIQRKSGKIKFHHGMCVGSDEGFHSLVRQWVRDSIIIGHPPTIGTLISRETYCDEFREPKPYLDRNHDIVDESDILIATPSLDEETRSGTWSTIRYARKTSTPIIILQ